MEKKSNNAWNNFTKANKNKFTAAQLKENWKKMTEAEKNEYAGPSTVKQNINIRCCLAKFSNYVKEFNLQSCVELEDSPFRFLLNLKGYELNTCLIKELASDFDLEEKSLTVDGKKHKLTLKDFDYILKIGDKDQTETTYHVPSTGFDSKRFLTKRGSEKLVCMKFVTDILKRKDNVDDFKRAFILLCLRYIVCVPSRGKLGTTHLKLVENVYDLKNQPWARLAMDSLVKGINTFKNPKGTGKRDLGGSMVFLQLYYLNKLTNKEPEELIKKGTNSSVYFDEEFMTETKQGIMNENDMLGDALRVYEAVSCMVLFHELRNYKRSEKKEEMMESDEEIEVKKEADEENESYNMQDVQVKIDEINKNNTRIAKLHQMRRNLIMETLASPHKKSFEVKKEVDEEKEVKMEVDEEKEVKMEVDEENVVFQEEDKELNEGWKCVGCFSIRTSKVPAYLCMFLIHFLENVEDSTCIASVEDAERYDCTKKNVIESLMPRKWVSSLVVNLLTEILNIRQVQMSVKGKTPIQRWYIPWFNCHNIRAYRIYGCQSRSKVKYHIKNEDLGSVKKIFFPMLKNFHWFLIVVNNEEQKVEVWNSLSSKLEEFTKEITCVCKFLDDKIRKTVPFGKYTRALLDVPKQLNACDCGVYVCRSMEFPDEVMEFHTEKWISQEERCLLLLRILRAPENMCAIKGSSSVVYKRKCTVTEKLES